MMHIVLTESLGIPDSLLNHYAAPLIEEGHTFSVYPKTGDVHVLTEEIQDADVIMLANMPMPKEALAACKHLQYVDVAFTGVDHIDLQTVKEKGALLSNASGYSNEAVAELALEMMLSLLRHVPQVEERCRQGKDKTGLVGRELKGKTVGIVGLGKIGKRTAQLCQAFGCRVIGTNRTHQTGEVNGITCMPLEDLLVSSDIVVLHCPLNASTHHLMNERTIDLMKDGALLLNLARGGVVDSTALANALKSGKLAGAGIDVFDKEPPLQPDEPLLHAPNTLLTPHVAFATEESMALRAEIVFENLRCFLEGNPVNLVNLD